MKKLLDTLIETMIIRPFYKESILEKIYSHKTFLYARDIYKNRTIASQLQFALMKNIYNLEIVCIIIVNYIIYNFIMAIQCKGAVQFEISF